MRVETKRKSRVGRAPMLGYALAVVCLWVLSGCGAPFVIQTPPDMVEVTTERDPVFKYRATSMEGAVLGVRVLDEPAGAGVESPGQTFWVDAIKRNLRLHKGYALVSEEAIQSANGVVGSLLKFGRDQRNESYTYWIAIFRTDRNLHLVDAGGRKDQFDKAIPSIEKALASYEVNP